MASDALSALVTTTTATATVTGTAINTVNGPGHRSYRAAIEVDSYVVATTGTAANTWIFTLQNSADNTTFSTFWTSPTLTATATAQTVQYDEQVVVTLARPYVRLVATQSAGGATTPTMVYRAYLGLGLHERGVY